MRLGLTVPGGSVPNLMATPDRPLSGRVTRPNVSSNLRT